MNTMQFPNPLSPIYFDPRRVEFDALIVHTYGSANQVSERLMKKRVIKLSRSTLDKENTITLDVIFETIFI